VIQRNCSPGVGASQTAVRGLEFVRCGRGLEHVLAAIIAGAATNKHDRSNTNPLNLQLLESTVVAQSQLKCTLPASVISSVPRLQHIVHSIVMSPTRRISILDSIVSA